MTRRALHSPNISSAALVCVVATLTPLARNPAAAPAGAMPIDDGERASHAGDIDIPARRAGESGWSAPTPTPVISSRPITHAASAIPPQYVDQLSAWPVFSGSIYQPPLRRLSPAVRRTTEVTYAASTLASMLAVDA